jgi:hypothetical protein
MTNNIFIHKYLEMIKNDNFKKEFNIITKPILKLIKKQLNFYLFIIFFILLFFFSLNLLIISKVFQFYLKKYQNYNLNNK